jgi:hypothetical protein
MRAYTYHFAGSDNVLVETAQGALELAGWPSHVLTGRYMFDLGDNERNTRPNFKDKP